VGGEGRGGEGLRGFAFKDMTNPPKIIVKRKDMRPYQPTGLQAYWLAFNRHKDKVK
jgi:hypothetical protein